MTTPNATALPAAQALQGALASTLDEVTIDGLPRRQGKVRDVFTLPGGALALVASDRLSAFDRVLTTIPLKGEVLTRLSAWWFGQIEGLGVRHHLVSQPDPNVLIVREAEPLPVEIVVRGYITGVTDTSLWTLYSRGEALPYGLDLPVGLRRNDPLPEPVITPTTKALHGAHDRPLSREEILARGIVEPGLYAEVERAALAVFARGQEVARRAGFVLVDTKYEFGLIGGELALIDEIHTPDASRYWLASSVEADREAPEHYDKEHARRWFAAQGYRGDGPPPVMPDALRVALAERYITLASALMGASFEVPEADVAARIARSLSAL